VEVQQHGDAGRLIAQHGFADISHLHVDLAYRRCGIASWLLGQAADWLDLGHLDQLLYYCSPDDGYRTFLHHAGVPAHPHHSRMGGAHHDRTLNPSRVISDLRRCRSRADSAGVQDV
jgi:GNAT superfamily N-acetyltransferase